MADPSIEERIQAVVDSLLGNEPPGDPLIPRPRLDISRPNIHDSKGEFQFELEAVRTAIGGLKSTMEALFATEDDEPLKKEMVSRLQAALDEKAVHDKRSSKPRSVFELIQNNAVETGFYSNSIIAVYELNRILEHRERELLDQEQEFWTVSHRPPKYYARSIALRLARLYAKKTGKKPTFGTAREGSYPSTDYGRALEQIFEILEIKADVKKAAEWALDQLTEDDLNPPPRGLMGLGMSDRRAYLSTSTTVGDFLTGPKGVPE